MKHITLLTDFGLQDGYPGVMKGVIWSICPDAQIADLSHTTAPHDIQAGALLLEQTVPYFPAGTVHIGVIDPGVGTNRRAIAAKLGQQFFVGPDNGLLTCLLEHSEQKQEETTFIHLDKEQYWLPQVSSSFHGRDIFAPAGAHLAKGTPISSLGSPISDPIRLHIARPEPQDNGWKGRIIHIDHFGNLITNIGRNFLLPFSKIYIRCGEHTIEGLSHTFGSGNSGDVIAIIDSSERLSICVVNGNAAEYLDCHVDDEIEIVSHLW